MICSVDAAGGGEGVDDDHHNDDKDDDHHKDGSNVKLVWVCSIAGSQSVTTAIKQNWRDRAMPKSFPGCVCRWV